jgi:sugar transferase (PEP-CTERM/EpsH1 system associated)
VRILFLAHCVPYPADKGERIRVYHQLSHLATRHRVHLLCLSRPGEDDLETRQRALEGLVDQVEIFRLQSWRSTWSMFSALLLGRPLSVGYFSHGALERRVAALPKEAFDVVIASCSSTARYALAARTLPGVLDLVDADSAKWKAYASRVPPPRSWLYSLEARRLAAYEGSLSRRFRRVLVTAPREARQLDLPAGVVDTVPNGVDSEHFRPAGEPLPRRAPTVVFTGQMDYFPNVDAVDWFAREILPRLAVRVNGLRFVIVGRRPSEAVRRLGNLPGVEVTGEVEDVRPYLGRAAVFVAPLRIARGVQNKVLESMASGVPVAMTSEVAAGFEDTSLSAGEDYLVADSAEAFVEAVGRLLLDREGALRIAASARRKVSSDITWERSMDRLESILGQVTAERSPRERTPLSGLGLLGWKRREAAGADR